MCGRSFRGRPGNWAASVILAFLAGLPVIFEFLLFLGTNHKSRFEQAIIIAFSNIDGVFMLKQPECPWLFLTVARSLKKHTNAWIGASVLNKGVMMRQRPSERRLPSRLSTHALGKCSFCFHRSRKAGLETGAPLRTSICPVTAAEIRAVRRSCSRSIARWASAVRV